MKLKLIDEWRHAYKFASVQLAAFAAILAGILAANPPMVLGLLSMLPNGKLKIAVAIGVGLIVFVVPALARLIEKNRHA